MFLFLLTAIAGDTATETTEPPETTEGAEVAPDPSILAADDLAAKLDELLLQLDDLLLQLDEQDAVGPAPQ